MGDAEGGGPWHPGGPFPTSPFELAPEELAKALAVAVSRVGDAGYLARLEHSRTSNLDSIDARRGRALRVPPMVLMPCMRSCCNIPNGIRTCVAALKGPYQVNLRRFLSTE
jgi:hypothetical protein